MVSIDPLVETTEGILSRALALSIDVPSSPNALTIVSPPIDLNTGYTPSIWVITMKFSELIDELDDSNPLLAKEFKRQFEALRKYLQQEYLKYKGDFYCGIRSELARELLEKWLS
jgi:hypothetical protein